MTLKHLRPASAMIELIFALVVMSIAILSAPMMLESANKSNNVAFEQESIAIIASHASSMLTYAWDEQNTQTHPAPNSILAVVTGDKELDGNNTHIGLRQTNLSNATVTGTFGMNKENEVTGGVTHFEALPDDVDDFHAVEANLSIAKAGDQKSTQGDFMDLSVRMRSSVTYLDDTANYIACGSPDGCAFSKPTEASWAAMPGSTNIKLITTTLTSSNVEGKRITLRAFMCNIGAAQPNTRAGI